MTAHDPRRRHLVLDAGGTMPLAEEKSAAAPASWAPELSNALRSLQEELATTLLPASAIVQRWMRIGVLAADALAQMAPFAEPSKAASDDATHQHSALVLDERDIALRVRSDAFFRVRRVADMRQAQLSYELVKLIARVAPDIAAAPVSLAHTSALVACFDDLICRLSDAAVLPERNREEERAVTSPPEHQPATTSAVGRWRSGHHLFFTATQATTSYLQRAERALQVSAETAARDLDRAALHLRAMSAALWYAGAIPSALYTAQVRPLMNAESRPGEGFSGLDSYDNLALTFAIEAVRSLLLRPRSADPAALAGERMLEAMVEHHEHHVLVAATMIGTATSLHRDADQAAPQVPAVEILRRGAAEAAEQLHEVRDATYAEGKD